MTLQKKKTGAGITVLSEKTLFLGQKVRVFVMDIDGTGLAGQTITKHVTFCKLVHFS